VVVCFVLRFLFFKMLKYERMPSNGVLVYMYMYRFSAIKNKHQSIINVLKLKV